MWNQANVRALLLKSVLLIGVFAVLPALAQENIKIAVVDLDRAVLESKHGQALKEKMEAFKKKTQTEGQALADKAVELQKQLQEGAQSLSEAKMAELKKALDDQTIAFRRFEDDKNREGQTMQAEGLQDIERRLGPVIKKLKDDGKYDLIMNRVGGVVLSADASIDITDKVITALNAAN